MAAHDAKANLESDLQGGAGDAPVEAGGGTATSERLQQIAAAAGRN
jgi:hypothetical protein